MLAADTFRFAEPLFHKKPLPQKKHFMVHPAMLVQKYTVDPLPLHVCFGPKRPKSSIGQVQSVLTLVALPNGRGAATHDLDVFWRFGYASYYMFACLEGPLVTHLLVYPSCLGGSAKIALCRPVTGRDAARPVTRFSPLQLRGLGGHDEYDAFVLCPDPNHTITSILPSCNSERAPLRQKRPFSALYI